MTCSEWSCYHYHWLFMSSVKTYIDTSCKLWNQFCRRNMEFILQRIFLILQLQTENPQPLDDVISYSLQNAYLYTDLTAIGSSLLRRGSYLNCNKDRIYWPENYNYRTFTASDNHQSLPDHQRRGNNHTKVQHLVIELQRNSFLINKHTQLTAYYV